MLLGARVLAEPVDAPRDDRPVGGAGGQLQILVQRADRRRGLALLFVGQAQAAVADRVRGRVVDGVAVGGDGAAASPANSRALPRSYGGRGSPRSTGALGVARLTASVRCLRSAL